MTANSRSHHTRSAGAGSDPLKKFSYYGLLQYETRFAPEPLAISPDAMAFLAVATVRQCSEDPPAGSPHSGTNQGWRHGCWSSTAGGRPPLLADGTNLEMEGDKKGRRTAQRSNGGKRGRGPADWEESGQKKGRSAIGAPPHHLHKDIVNSGQTTALRQAGRGYTLLSGRPCRTSSHRRRSACCTP